MVVPVGITADSGDIAGIDIPKRSSSRHRAIDLAGNPVAIMLAAGNDGIESTQAMVNHLANGTSP